MTETAPFKKVVIIGIGLIGSSLALALRSRGLAKQIIGVDQAAATCTEAVGLGVVSEATRDLVKAVEAADLIIISTPVGAMFDILGILREAAPPDAIIMDVGSVKGAISALGDAQHLLVPAHPVAGTEGSGPGAGFDTLFENRWCILTPLAREDAPYHEAVNKVKELWEALGSSVTIMDARHHDVALAVTSHLPHLIAFTLVRAAEDMENVHEAELVKYSAGGFRDFTRIAASDPTMWRDVFLHNKDAVLEVLARFSEELAIMQRAIRWGDGQTLFEAFDKARGVRKAIIEAGQETDKTNFGRDKRPPE